MDLSNQVNNENVDSEINKSTEDSFNEDEASTLSLSNAQDIQSNSKLKQHLKEKVTKPKLKTHTGHFIPRVALK